MAKRKYDYNTEIRTLPAKVKADIWEYAKAGWTMAESNMGESDRMRKAEFFCEGRTINDIGDYYPIDTLVQELNK